MLTTMVGQWEKIKKKHWLKHPERSPKKETLDQNINDSKSHIWNSFFEKIISSIQLFYIHPHVPMDIIRSFLTSDFLAESLKGNKN